MNSLILLTALPPSIFHKLGELPHLFHFIHDLEKKWNLSDGWIRAIVTIAVIGFIIYCFCDDSDEKKQE